MLGRRTSLSSTDTGLNNYHYDGYGNLSWEDSPELRKGGKRISYEYDDFSRLTRIDYPYSADTVYEYGLPGAPSTCAGRIARQTDESGSTEFQYGLLGEKTSETRTIVRASPNEPVSATMAYRSDYLGRMQSMTYPDGEKVTYTYDRGGNVSGVAGEKDGYGRFDYVDYIGYDEYGQRVYIKYGNGVSTTYRYDEARRWLSEVSTVNKYGEQYQNMKYSFDTQGNVLGYANEGCGSYSTSQRYTYDALYQLTGASGKTRSTRATADVPSYTASYSQTFTFSGDGLCNMTNKTSSQDLTLGDDLNYALDYVYADGYAHRLARAGERRYKYDDNGNVVREQDKAFEESEAEDTIVYHRINSEGDGRYSTDYSWAAARGGSGAYATTKCSYYYRDYEWTERNMLRRTSNDQYVTTYLYGADGQRASKSSARGETLYFNRMFTRRFDEAYLNAGGRMSKHVFLGEERIATKQVDIGISEGYAETDTAAEARYTYYYHSDHLGSAQYVTDYEGGEYERIEYTPYGETSVDKTTAGGYFDTPYKFTAKERDAETGLYYYGARYLDPKYSRWISADPALGEYIPRAPIDDDSKKHNQNLPGMGGVFNAINLHLYHYAGNNPVRYLDPDGRKTTILIIHANSGWEKIVNGSHVAVHFSNPGNGSDGERLQQTLYDPSGSYVADNGFGTGKYRPSSGVFTGDIPADLSSYINSVLDRENGEYINAYTIDTTPEEEAKMVEKAMENGDGTGFDCANNTSDVLKILGFKHTMTPGGLEKQLQESKKVVATKTYTNEVNNE